MKTEYGQRPEAFTLVRLANGLCELLLRENIAEAAREDGSVCYTADEYCLTTQYREGLEEAIAGNLTAWVESARTEEEQRLGEEARARRAALLAQTDWTQALDAPLCTQSKDEMCAYRQALRDIPAQVGFPYGISWPVPPVVRKEQNGEEAT